MLTLLKIYLWKYPYRQYLTHWGWDKMDAISQTTFSRAFSSMKIIVFWLNFHWNMFARVQLTMIHYLNQWWLVYRRKYASLGLNELNNWDNKCLALKAQVVIAFCMNPKVEGFDSPSGRDIFCLSEIFDTFTRTSVRQPITNTVARTRLTFQMSTSL